MDELPTSQATLLSFLAGPINLRKFIATRPEGTRQPGFEVHYPTRPDPKLKNHYPSGPAPNTVVNFKSRRVLETSTFCKVKIQKFNMCLRNEDWAGDEVRMT